MSTPDLTKVRRERPTPETRKVTLVNLSEFDQYAHRTYGHFHIPGKPKPMPYVVLHIYDMTEWYDIGDDRKVQFPWKAEDIAEDIIRDFEPHAVFIAEGPAPTQAEIVQATNEREEYFKQQVFAADQIWARSHDHKEISDVMRRAALHLNAEREWSYVPVKMGDCEYCGGKVKPGVAVCPHCRAVLDVDKALRGGLISLEEYGNIKEARIPRPSKGKKPIEEVGQQGG